MKRKGSLTVSIPDPCTQFWNDMTPVEGGRHCLHCQKSVIDFSSMTDKEILAVVSKHEGNLCGNFRSEQLSRVLVTDPEPRHSFLPAAMLASLIATVIPANSSAHTPGPSMEQVPVIHIPEENTPCVFKGWIVDSLTNEGLQGVTIVLKGSGTVGSVTDDSGKFQLTVPSGSPELTFRISYLGYNAKEVTFNAEQLSAPVIIPLQQSATDLQELVVTSYVVTRRSYTTGAISVKTELSAHDRLTWWERIAHFFKKKDLPNKIINPMPRTLSLTLPLLLTVQLLSAQQKMPSIKANSLKVDIRDGDIFKKGNWTIMPKVKPDVYTTAFSSKPRKVTFYTDIDSISFNVKPNTYTQFNILVNNKDTALTGIFCFDPLATLKKAGKYNVNEKREDPLPAFTYQSADNPNLDTLRKTFRLDSIAGYGNEVSRILNLMHWMHNLVPHDGGHGNPEVMNAMNMIAVCAKEKRGLNCRGLAMALNECYLALGFKSRYVTCLPKDSLRIDNDCHVINMVYSTELKKWLWIDPTFDAYVMNEKGELLSIEEVRERIIDGRPLILNPEANWNHKISQTKEDYLYSYMAKNLYILECSVSSEYDTETRQPGKSVSYVQLIPLDYFKKALGKGVSTNTVTKWTIVTNRTNNPRYFWQAP